ncbi:DUF4179 domain-containing protein [Paenibacillus xylanilyticus]|uniref:DUF4179 domain-containing protein n=1 Tax=Paenibacillus xylanilyticus TaxID=248903 RepID=UPI00129E80C9|nr:DUF4179 domain-containing protein [Paenibacillus xylanilyticus]
MRTSPEEKVLLADAYQVKLEKQQLNPADTAFAIQRGLAKARARRTTSGIPIKWITAVLITAITAACLLLGPYRGIMIPQTTAVEPIQDWGVLEPFRKLAETDIDRESMESAINNGYVQFVNRSVRTGVYQLNIDAIMADENRITVLYTAKTDDSQEIYNVNSARITDGVTHRKLDNGNVGGTQLGKGMHTLHGRETIDIDRANPLPEKLLLDFQIASVDPGKLDDPQIGTKVSEMHYSDRLKMTLDLDPKFSVPQTEVLELNKLFTVGGYEVMLSEVEISPLVTRARFIYEPEKEIDYQTKLKISDAVNPVKIVSTTKDGKQIELSSVGGAGTEDGMIYSFSSNLLDDPQSLVLKLRAPGKVYNDLQEAEREMIKLEIK